MKKLILLFLLSAYLNSNAQSDINLQNAVKDYSATVYKNFTHGAESFKALMIKSLQQQGYYYERDILRGMERIGKDHVFREATYRVWKIISDDAPTLKLQFISIGMNAANAETMGVYIVKLNNPNGMLLSNNYDEKQFPTGDSPIALARFTNLVLPDDDGKKTGKIAVRISVNKDGEVTDAIPGVRGTTLSEKDLWQKCKEALIKSRLKQPDPPVQSGIVVFNFRVK